MKEKEIHSNTLTVLSKIFINKWSAVLSATTGLTSALGAGINTAQGNNESAIIFGIASGLTITTTLFVVSNLRKSNAGAQENKTEIKPSGSDKSHKDLIIAPLPPFMFNPPK